MKEIFFIYGLQCPISNEIRYVGKSVEPKNRFKRHLRSQELNANTHKARWLKTLLKKKLVPFLIILEKTNRNKWEAREKFWIQKLKNDGLNLTNETPGGEGRRKGFKHKPEAIAKIRLALKNRTKESYEKSGKSISKALKGRPLSEKNKVNLSIAHKKVWGNLSDLEKLEHTKHLRHGWSQKSRDKLSKTLWGKKHKNGTSKYPGVCWFKRDRCWRAYTTINGKQKHLGYFIEEIEAFRAYCWAVKNLGEKMPKGAKL